ncbi:hypothetical protein [Draconibacterium sediminis]|uniref:hypothetical protein n=1 Tax=Draconibacterium sediminis TaxID=1544798 RepID=UPI0026EF4CDB|nr:hypothetical protein [Draconibacterium sediminis]
MEKYQRQVIHLYFIETDEHHYFGSIPAMYENFTAKQLGVSMSSLYNRWKKEPWINKKVILRKGRLVVKNK